MSKWIKKEAFAQFREKIKEDDSKKNEFVGRWETPDKGSVDKPIEYELRLIPDKKNNFYKKILYHMFKVDDKWVFSLCPKTYDMDNWCACCATSMKLYTGTEQDKNDAYAIKRKEKYVVNSYIVDDPRDSDKDDDKKAGKTVKLYEFPAKVESLIRSAMTDEKNGVGMGAFDPSEEGYNFILKVGATKADAKGRSWADYSLSSFARKSSALAETDDKIEKILDSAYNLDDYIKTLEKPEEDIIKALKSLGFFDLISTEYYKKRGVESSNEVTSKESQESRENQSEASNESFNESSHKTTQEQNTQQSSTELDEELLRELENL